MSVDQPAGTASEAVEFYAPQPVLAAYVREALEANPGLQESLALYRAALERVPIATSLPDPMVGFSQALRSVETRVGPQVNSVTVSQVLPWFGKRDLRGKVASQSAVAAHELHRARQREVIAQVKKAFYNLAYVDSAVGITREEHALLGHYEEVSQARYASGQGLQHAVIKIQAEITKVDNRLDTLQEQREILVARLNMLMNRRPEQPVPAIAPSAVPRDVPLDPTQLEALGDGGRPEIRAADALIGRGERAVDLAHKGFWPDLTVGAGFVNVGGRTDPAGVMAPPPDNGRNAFSVTFGFTVPIQRAKYRADVRRAADELTAAQYQRADAHNEMAFADPRSGGPAPDAGRTDSPHRRRAAAADRRSVAIHGIRVQTGQVGVLDLLDSERSRLDVRLIQSRDIADYLVALADLERAIGAPFPDATRVP